MRIICDVRDEDVAAVTVTADDGSTSLEYAPLDGSGCCLMDQSTQLGGGYCVIYVGVTDTSSYTDEELEDIVIVTEAYVATYFMTNAQLITL